MNYLDWNRILEEQCPSCGYQMKEEGNSWICDNHKGKPFTIPTQRFLEIQRDLKAKQDFSFPDF